MKNTKPKSKAKAKRAPLADLKPAKTESTKGGAPKRKDPYQNFNFRVE